MKTVIIIPARMESKRLPGKPLMKIYGKTIIQHTYEKARQVCDYVYVATDSELIAKTVNDFGGRFAMTADFHRNGTERCSEASMKIREKKGLHFDCIVNLQCDLPFVNPEVLLAVMDSFEEDPEVIHTPCVRISDNEEVMDTNIVKAYFDNVGYAMYFSRYAIPYSENYHHKHIGIYAYGYDKLNSLASMAECEHEKSQSLEQMRWLYNQEKIFLVRVSHETHSIDTYYDIQRYL